VKKKKNVRMVSQAFSTQLPKVGFGKSTSNILIRYEFKGKNLYRHSHSVMFLNPEENVKYVFSNIGVR